MRAMNKIARNLLSGMAGILVLAPAQPVPFITPVLNGKSDAEALRQDGLAIGGYFMAAIGNVETQTAITARKA